MTAKTALNLQGECNQSKDVVFKSLKIIFRFLFFFKYSSRIRIGSKRYEIVQAVLAQLPIPPYINCIHLPEECDRGKKTHPHQMNRICNNIPIGGV